MSSRNRVHRPDRIVLIGPSGSGKSHLTSLIAQALGFEAVDIDAEIEKRIDMTIAEFFERFGEPAFRAIETVDSARCVRFIRSRNSYRWRCGSGACELGSDETWSGDYWPGSQLRDAGGACIAPTREAGSDGGASQHGR